MRRVWFTVLGSALFFAASLLPLAAAKGDLLILHFNDVYEIEPVDDGARGGAARVATLIEERQGADPLILFSGDAFSPSLMSSIFQGAQMVDVFNRLGLDYAVFGNHEFDFGPEVALERFGASEFTWLAANLVESGGDQPYGGASAHALVEWNGVQVGIIGLIGDWFDLTNMGEEAEYVDFVAAGRAAAQELRAQGAEFVVAITHMYLAQDEQLAQAVPEIDLILGGHDHEPITTVVNGTLIWKTGSDFRTLGELGVYLGNGFSPLVVPRFLHVDAAVPDEPAMAEVVAGYAAALDEELGTVIGETAVPLDATRATVRTAESNYGNLIADAMREHTGADVAIANGGGIRTDMVYEPGPLTRGDVQAVQPFGNVIMSVEVTGEQLLAALENAVSQVEVGAGRFPHVSGMAMVYDPSRPAGDRVLEVLVAGQPLDPAATYVLAVNNFVAEGGDGFEMLIDAPRVITEEVGVHDATVVADYIERHSPVAPAVEGRVTTP